MMARTTIVVLVVLLCLGLPAFAEQAGGVFRIGLIGLDTSHVTAFQAANDLRRTEYRVVAGYPGVSADIESSAGRVEGYTKQPKDESASRSSRQHRGAVPQVTACCWRAATAGRTLRQARPVIAAKKPLFTDASMAAVSRCDRDLPLPKRTMSLGWSSSSLRFGPGVLGMRNNDQIGEVRGCDAFSPCSLEEHHPGPLLVRRAWRRDPLHDHGAGPESVQRLQTDGTEFVVGRWKRRADRHYRGLGRAAGRTTRDGLRHEGHRSQRWLRRLRAPGQRDRQVLRDGPHPGAAAETIEIFAFDDRRRRIEEAGRLPSSPRLRPRKAAK